MRIKCKYQFDIRFQSFQTFCQPRKKSAVSGESFVNINSPIINRIICNGHINSVTNNCACTFHGLQNASSMSERHILVASDTTMWVSVPCSIFWNSDNRHLRLQEHIPNSCLPQTLGGDVPETNAHDFYELCKENAHIVEQNYRYLKSWTRKEETPHPFFM